MQAHGAPAASGRGGTRRAPLLCPGAVVCYRHRHRREGSVLAKLYFRYGAMGSSKTANAIMVRHNYLERNQRVLMLKPMLDRRDGANLAASRCGLAAVRGEAGHQISTQKRGCTGHEDGTRRRLAALVVGHGSSLSPAGPRQHRPTRPGMHRTRLEEAGSGSITCRVYDAALACDAEACGASSSTCACGAS